MKMSSKKKSPKKNKTYYADKHREGKKEHGKKKC
jgi:hypothetical protein